MTARGFLNLVNNCKFILPLISFGPRLLFWQRKREPDTHCLHIHRGRNGGGGGGGGRTWYICMKSLSSKFN